uniref:Transmembrane protein 200B n=2 Tax=Nothobranchius korthausae TaxID=1143690 RepID=A0A1A8FQQ9_9TELE
MKTQTSQGVTPASPSCRRKYRFHFRGRKKEGAIQGKLRIRSLPGAFLVLGVAVVAVGTALAVVQYWPYRASLHRGVPEGGHLSESQTSGGNLSTRRFLSSSGLLHVERMKLLGPVIMGVGLFILICANTVLYENRDRETQMLLAQMRSVICSVSAAVPSAGLRDAAAANLMNQQYQWVSSLPAAHLNILCPQQMADSEPLRQSRSLRDLEDSSRGVYQKAVLKTEALHHHGSEPPLSPLSSSCDNCQTQMVSEQRRQNIPFLKLSVSLVSASSMSNLETEELDAPAALPRRCHSLSHRIHPYIVQTGLGPEAGLHTSEEDHEREQLKSLGGQCGSQVCVTIPGQRTNPLEELTHHSWPRLDLAGVRRYLKLENKEDSVDKLLDQLELQSCSCERGFGSGPFQ